MTAVELDPEVAQIADRYFNVRPEHELRHRHRGRPRLARPAPTSTSTSSWSTPIAARSCPFHLLTTEFYKLVAEHLKPGGVAVQNVEPTTMLFDSAVATIKAAFDHVVFFEGQGNIVIVAYNGPEKDEATLQRHRGRAAGASTASATTSPRSSTRRFTPDWNDKTAAAHRRLRAGRVPEGDRAPQREADMTAARRPAAARPAPPPACRRRRRRRARRRRRRDARLHHARLRDGGEPHPDAALRQRHLHLGDDHLDRRRRPDGRLLPRRLRRRPLSRASRFAATIKLVAAAYLFFVYC